MKIAVIGSGISGLVCAYLLAAVHEVVLFEREDRIGGHTHTVTVQHEGRDHDVDTGFIVFNERNYPGFCRLLQRLGVASRPTTMSFSVRDDRTDFEYGGNSLSGIIGPWSNLFKPRWWRLIRGVSRLGPDGRELRADLPESATLHDLVASGRLSPVLVEDYLLPMAGAIWSAPRNDLLNFPAQFLLRFFDNHGMLNLRERPQWRTVVGGSHAYLRAMRPVLDPITRLGCPAESVTRSDNGVEVCAKGRSERFDQVILAAHADEALAMLTDPSPDEQSILSAMPYQANDVVLHSDASLLPKRRRCWAAWNYRRTEDPSRPIAVTYNMSILQGLSTQEPLCVTLNDAASIDPARVLRRFTYAHPLYTLAGEAARSGWSAISGVRQTHYCGAYWGNGFHEDGVASALRVCSSLGAEL